MDWMNRLQKVIEYIEMHITDDPGALQLKSVAKQVYSSEYEFQKVFSIVTGVTVGEYIRNRKLSLAGEEILLNDLTLLEIGLKYGYGTAESFTKAFTRFHGTTPNAVRKKGAGLKQYNKLTIHLQLEGGSSLDYRVIDHNPFKVMAKTKVFQIQSMGDREKNIPEYIEKCRQEGMYDILYKEKDDTTYFKDSIIGIHDGVGCKVDGSEFRFSIGVENNDRSIIPKGYEMVEIPAQKWLVFHCKGTRPISIQKLWHQVYSSFLPSSSYQIKELGTMEICREGFRNEEDVISELWLPLSNGMN